MMGDAIERLEEDHYQCAEWCRGGEPHCFKDQEPWPCDVAAVIELARRARGGAARCGEGAVSENAHETHQEGRSAAIDPRKVLEDHRPEWSNWYAPGGEVERVLSCAAGCGAWLGDAETGGCPARLLALRVIELEGALADMPPAIWVWTTRKERMAVVDWMERMAALRDGPPAAEGGA